MTACRFRRERGQVVVLFALMIPVFLGLGAGVIGIGNWYTHAKNLQTKADAGAFAGGGVWAFPCVETGTAPTSTQRIVDETRLYVGEHTRADGTPYTGTTFNPQVGKVPGSDVHVVLNGSAWYDNDSNPLPVEQNDPNNPSICDAKVLDVKVTEDDAFPLFSLLPLFPDVKRKARVQIEQIEGLNGLLPIAVRVPKPASAAAIFYNEASGTILDMQHFCEDRDASVPVPGGLGGWSTFDPLDPNPDCTSTSWASVNLAPTTGVVIATSFRPRCGTGSPPVGQPCMAFTATNIDSFCNQANGAVRCVYATGGGASQVTRSGVQFIRAYPTGTVTDGPPELRGAWFDQPSAGCGSYFSVTSSPCTVQLNADVDIGTAVGRNSGNTDVKYGLVYGTTGPEGDVCLDSQERPNCDMGGGWTASVTLDPRFDNQGDPDGLRHAVAIRVRLKNTTVVVGGTPIVCGPNYNANCQWFFTAGPPTTNWPGGNASIQNIFDNPVQRSFTGIPDVVGPMRWLRLTTDQNCDGGADFVNGDPRAASQPAGTRCFFMEMGLKGALATDQDEPPFGFNFKGSQSGSVDCDDGYPNWKTEVENSCRPFYKVNDFTRTPTSTPAGPCPWPSGSSVSWNTFMNPPAPYDSEWPPYTCLRTDGPPSPGQVEKGLKQRIFLNENQNTCPGDSATDFVPGRNYWDDSNNASGGKFAFADLGVHPNNLKPATEDKRLVTLFLTAYDSFTGTGGDVFPVVGFANFYITGWGKITGGGGLQIDDPCPGNTQPPDLVITSGLSGAEMVWGHFINVVTPGPFTTGGNGVLCKPEQLQPCVAVLVD